VENSVRVMTDIVKNEAAGLVADTSVPCVSVILPVFNEVSTVAVALERVLEERTRKEVIIVDDGSHDGSEEIIEQFIRNLGTLDDRTVRIVFLKHMENEGKGRAIRTALQVARGRFVIVQDADLEVRPSCYAALLNPLVKSTAELVIGRRRRSLTRSLSLHAIGVAALGLIVRTLYGYQVRDAACCYKVLSLENLRRMNLQADRFEFCPEVIAKASKLGLTLHQVDVDYFPRGVDRGKKLRLVRDGIEAVLTLLRYRQWQPTPNNGLEPDASNVLSSEPGFCS
jgi:dolichol-phosphate mannosyltransferase